ncbi:hypothetical protein AB3S75_032031 [Citrus x aurantiifolia]
MEAKTQVVARLGSRRKSKAQHPKAKAADNKLVSLLLAFSVTFSKLSPLFLPFIQHSQNADTRLKLNNITTTTTTTTNPL